MNVLGLGTEGDSGAALAVDGSLVAAVNEERLCRMKLVVGFPRQSIRETLRLGAVSVRDLDAVLIGGTSDLFVDQLERFDGWFQQPPTGFGGRIKRAAATFARYRDDVPALESAYYAALAPSFWHRRRAIRRILRREFDVQCPIEFVDHHFAHVASAYFTSGFDDALVVSVDGGGDARSSLVYAVRSGRFEFVNAASAYHSLGNYYAYVTHLCGFKAMKHEGKITGLAAYGEPKYVPVLRSMIDDENGHLINRGRVVGLGAIREIERRLPRGWTREDLAASIQRHFEDVTTRYIRHWVRRTGISQVALAGGVAANVRINEEVHSIPEISRIFIHPHMGDGGLSAGAALSACVPGVLPRTMRRSTEPLSDVYLGPSLDEASIANVLGRYQLTPEVLEEPMEERIAALLAEGHVVARAHGRMEYGPRALGNRSILYQPTDRDVNDWLNKNLHRTEFMPFAPSVLHESRELCFESTSGGEHAAEFMTITFHGSAWGRRHLRGVMHLDGTARPHLVRRDRNPGLYAIIEAFQRRTGLPGVINTSFNMHEEPIVCSADDCVRAFLDGQLDYLAIGGHLIRHPRGIQHPLKPAVVAKASHLASLVAS